MVAGFVAAVFHYWEQLFADDPQSWRRRSWKPFGSAHSTVHLDFLQSRPVPPDCRHSGPNFTGFQILSGNWFMTLLAITMLAAFVIASFGRRRPSAG
jgi:hypothetical protein